MTTDLESRPAAAGRHSLEAMLLECQVSALNHARACATGEADAPTIYARIDSLIYTAQQRLKVLAEGEPA